MHDHEIDEYLEVALAETFSKPGTADVTPADRAKLKGLLKYYAAKPHPFTSCKRDQMKHGLSEEHANRRCAVLKDLIRGSTKWRGKGKKEMSEEELAEIRLDIPEEFTAWLNESSEQEIQEYISDPGQGQEDKKGILRYIANLMGIGEDDASEDTGEAESGAEIGADEERLQPEEEQPESETAEGQTAPAVATLAYQLPIDYQRPVELGSKRWRKHLLPLGKKIEHDGETLDFSRGMLSEMLESWKQKAFDTVYATIGHTKDADKGRGVLRDLFLKEDGNPETDGLYGDFELSEAGEEIIKNNLGQIGTSVGYLPKYPRGDGKTFSNALQHVAFVPTPAVPGLQPWVSVSLSEQANVVDLTQAEFSVDNPRKEDGPVEENANVETNEEVKVEKTTELSMAEMQRAIELANERAESAETRAKQAEERSGKNARTLAEEKVDRYLDEQKRSRGVPRFVTELARPLLLEAELSETPREYETVELSADGATKKTFGYGEVVKRLLEATQGAVDVSEEEGRSDVDPETSNDEAQHQQIVALSQEKGISYREAFQELSSRGEVTL